MANTLTGLIPDFHEAMDVISREMVGFIPAVTRDSRLDRVAINQNVTIPVTRTPGANATNTPGVNAPDTGDDTIDNVQVSITKSKHQPIRFNGEETLGLSNAGISNFGVVALMSGYGVTFSAANIALTAFLGASAAGVSRRRVVPAWLTTKRRSTPSVAVHCRTPPSKWPSSNASKAADATV